MPSTPLVYIIDDDASFNELLTHVLKKYGVKSESFQTSEAVLKRARVQAPDLCIVDLNLGPREKGYDLILALRQIIRTQMPIIICSSEKNRDVISHAIELGADDFILKPLDRGILTAKLLQFIKTNELDYSQTWVSGGLLQTEIETGLSVQIQLQQVEEDGLIVRSKHLILKGSVVTLSGDMIQEISGKNRSILTTALSSELNAGEETYSVYLEFDLTDKQLIENVRNWLSRKLNRIP